ncbi:hypothetical protein LIER_04306 [Lithospermum erythrorhizon]|uniref:Uncharacterized protein n=1 Tax=Lithospermum erythrorhizon TaxID=34254 RepID=A0AAV3NXM7_LITER
MLQQILHNQQHPSCSSINAISDTIEQVEEDRLYALKVFDKMLDWDDQVVYDVYDNAFVDTDLEMSSPDGTDKISTRRNLQEYDRAALSRQLDETQQSWLLGHGEKMKKKKKYVDLGCIMVSRKIFKWLVGCVVAAALVTVIVIG